MTDDIEFPLTASGGWCAPSETLYDTGKDPDEVFMLPEISVQRGGIQFRTDWTPEERAEQERWARHVRDMAWRMAAARHHAIEKAVAIAYVNGWDLHVHEPPTAFSVHHATESELLRVRHIGIEFTPAKHGLPTIHEHPYRDNWEWDD